MTESNEAARRALSHVAKVLGAEFLNRGRMAPFKNRGLSNRTIQTLVDCSIDVPERLLFMTEDQIKSIPGIGKASIAEIRAYRNRFTG